MPEHVLAKIGDDPFSKLVGEIEPKARRDRQGAGRGPEPEKHLLQGGAVLQLESLIQHHPCAAGEGEQRGGR